jgi:hypothetical protein
MPSGDREQNLQRLLPMTGVVPRDTDYSSLIESDVPVVVQHTRLDSRKAALALLSTLAFPAE